MPKKRSLIALVSATLIGTTTLGILWLSKAFTANYHEGCIAIEPAQQADTEFVVCAASESAKHARSEAITLEHPSFDLRNGVVNITAARNETVAFQLIVQRTHPASTNEAQQLKLEAAAWVDSQSSLPVTDVLTTHWFAAHYHYVDKGGYQWGPKSKVRPWPAYYPDALVPNHGRCSVSATPIFNATNLDLEVGDNQSFWFDVYVPKTLPVGTYNQSISITVEGATTTVPIQLEVFPASLPDKPTIAAVGEIYRAYLLEGAGTELNTDAYKQMSHCYQQIAHQHRTVFFERVVTDSTQPEWPAYQQIVEPILSGDLFTKEEGYLGPGENTPVSVWRTPWQQEINIEHTQRITKDDLNKLERDAASWRDFIVSIDAKNTDYFAYIFDEVDGPDDTMEPDERVRYITDVHDDMDAVQQAIDEGAGTDLRIDLLWTSHSNPSQWQDNPALDLTGKIRLWAPNASAADVPFLQERQADGNKIWFYHSGHPAIGVHSINASGIEMRTWGVVGAKYGFDGQFKWAVNLGSNERPFAEPSYKPDDDRFGNGVFVYPGNQLPKIGYPATPGPIPSMRLKAWRRGLQDAELIHLVRQHAEPSEVEQMEKSLSALIPRALSEGRRKAAWSDDTKDWIDFRNALLESIP